jgi:hypothetical protein
MTSQERPKSRLAANAPKCARCRKLMKVRILIPGRKVDDVAYRCEECGEEAGDRIMGRCRLFPPPCKIRRHGQILKCDERPFWAGVKTAIRHTRARGGSFDAAPPFHRVPRGQFTGPIQRSSSATRDDLVARRP